VSRSAAGARLAAHRISDPPCAPACEQRRSTPTKRCGRPSCAEIALLAHPLSCCAPSLSGARSERFRHSSSSHQPQTLPPRRLPALAMAGVSEDNEAVTRLQRGATLFKLSSAGAPAKVRRCTRFPPAELARRNRASGVASYTSARELQLLVVVIRKCGDARCLRLWMRAAAALARRGARPSECSHPRSQLHPYTPSFVHPSSSLNSAMCFSRATSAS
jgi:hypothetical protein